MSDTTRPDPSVQPPNPPDPAAALGDVPEGVRAGERARLEALAQTLYPPATAVGTALEAAAPTAFGSALPRWFWWLVVAGLVLGLAGWATRARPASGPVPQSTAVPGIHAGPAPGVAAAVDPAGPAAPTVVGGENRTADVAPPLVVTPRPGSALTVTAPSAAGTEGVRPPAIHTVATSELRPTPGGDAEAWPCPAATTASALAETDGPGPWVLGHVLSADCRPVVGAVVALTAPGGPEFLARTEADGSYALAAEPGVYRAELVEARGLAWLDGHALGQATVIELSLPDNTARARLLFLYQGDDAP